MRTSMWVTGVRVWQLTGHDTVASKQLVMNAGGTVCEMGCTWMTH